MWIRATLADTTVGERRRLVNLDQVALVLPRPNGADLVFDRGDRPLSVLTPNYDTLQNLLAPE